MRALPIKRLLPGRVSAAILLMAFALVSAACVQRISPDGVPAVPPGYGDRVPDAPLSGYIHISPSGSEESVGIDSVLVGQDGSEIPWQSDLKSISLWISPVDRATNRISLTAQFQFENEKSAATAQSVIQEARAGTETWVHRNGQELSWVFGNGANAVRMRGVVAEQQYISVERISNSVVRRSVLALPQAPRKPVVATGFVALPPHHIREVFVWLNEQAGIDLRRFGDVLMRIDADNAVFALYGDSLPVLSNDLSLKDIVDYGVTGLIIARTDMPTPLVSWGFNVGALWSDMERLEVDSGRAYRYQLDGAVVMAQVRRGDIQIAISSSQYEATTTLDLIPR